MAFLSDLWPWLLAAGAYVFGAAQGDLYQQVKSKIWPPPIPVDSSKGHPLLNPEIKRLQAIGVPTAFVPPLKRPAREAEGWTPVTVLRGWLRRPSGVLLSNSVLVRGSSGTTLAHATTRPSTTRSLAQIPTVRLRLSSR